MSFCPNCGTQISEGGRFCPNCGSPAPESDPYAGGGGYYGGGPRKDPNKTKRIIIFSAIGVGVVLVAVILVLILKGGLGGGKYKDYNDLIDDYFEYAENNDSDAIMKLYAPGVIDAVGMEYLDSWTYVYGRTVVSRTFNGINYYDSDDLADMDDVLRSEYGIRLDIEQYVDVSIIVDYYDDYGYYFDFDLVRVNGCWYILDIW